MSDAGRARSVHIIVVTRKRSTCSCRNPTFDGLARKLPCTGSRVQDWTRIGDSMCKAHDIAFAAAAPSPTLCTRVIAEVFSNLRLAWPQTLTMIMTFMPRLLLLVVVGHLEDGPLLIGAAGIGSMYANAAHLMLIRSSMFGVSALFSQAFGAGNHHRIGLVLIRTLVLQSIMIVCASLPLTAAAGPLLRAFGQPAEVAAHAQAFIWIRLGAVPGIILFTDLQTFLNAQRCVRLPMFVGAGGALAQVALVVAMTQRLGFLGAPLAMTLVELAQGALLFVASPWLLRRQRLRSWPAWRRDAHQALRGWGEILGKGAPAAAMVTSEWFGWECTLFLASGLCGGARETVAPPPRLASLPPRNLSSVMGLQMPPSGASACPEVEAIPICTQLMVFQFVLAFGVSAIRPRSRTLSPVGQAPLPLARLAGLPVLSVCLFLACPVCLSCLPGLPRLPVLSSWLATFARQACSAGLCAPPPRPPPNSARPLPLCLWRDSLAPLAAALRLPSQPCLATSIRVGNLLGEGRPADARLCAAVSLGLAAGAQACLATVAGLSRSHLAAIFVDDAVVVGHVVRLMPYTIAYSVLATLACGWSQQLLFGLGAPLRWPALGNFVAFYALGLPLGTALAYHTDMGVRGMWAGLVAAVGAIVLMQYTYLLLTTDWAAAAVRARERALQRDAGGACGSLEEEQPGRGLAAADAAKLEMAHARPQLQAQPAPAGA